MDFDEFCQMMAKQLVTALKEELKEALKTFSPGGSISASEWKKILTSLAEKMSSEEMDCLLKAADKSGRGNVKNDGEILPVLNTQLQHLLQLDRNVFRYDMQVFSSASS